MNLLSRRRRQKQIIRLIKTLSIRLLSTLRRRQRLEYINTLFYFTSNVDDLQIYVHRRVCVCGSVITTSYCTRIKRKNFERTKAFRACIDMKTLSCRVV